MSPTRRQDGGGTLARETSRDAAGRTVVSHTLPGLLASHAATRPTNVALREKEFGIWQEITWAEYLARVRALSLGLSELGVERGDRVAIIGDNRPEWMIVELAAQAGGVLPLGLYQDSIAGELARMLETAEARVIVAEDQEQVDKVLEVRDRLPRPRAHRLLRSAGDVRLRSTRSDGLRGGRGAG